MKHNSKIFFGLFVFLVAWGIMGCGLLSPALKLSNAFFSPEEERQGVASGMPKEINASVEPSAQIHMRLFKVTQAR